MSYFKSNLANLAAQVKTYSQTFQKKGENDLNFLMLRLGTNVIRILPAYNAEGDFFANVRHHKRIPPRGEKAKCPTYCFGPEYPCGVCEAERRASELGIDLGASGYFNHDRVAFNVVQRATASHPEEEVGILMVSAGVGRDIFNVMLGVEISEDGSTVSNPDMGIDITDPSHGADLIITMTETKDKRGRKRISYNTQLHPKKTDTPLFSDARRTEEVLGNLYDLKRVFLTPNDERIKETETLGNELLKHLGLGQMKISLDAIGSSVEEEVEEPAKPKAKKTPKVSHRKVEEPEQNSTPAPPGAPACFGKEYGDDVDRCDACPFELVCGSVSE